MLMINTTSVKTTANSLTISASATNTCMSMTNECLPGSREKLDRIHKINRIECVGYKASDSPAAGASWLLQNHSATQYLDRVPADAHVGNVLAVPGRTDEDFARPFHL